jgi:hypothetical protein
VLAQPVDRLDHRPPLQVADRGDADQVAGRAGGVLDAVQHGGRAEQRGLEADDAQRVGLAGDQGAGGEVAAVVQRLHRFENPGAGLLPYVRMLVEHPRHRLMGDTRELGDVTHDRRRLLRWHAVPLVAAVVAHSVVLTGFRTVPLTSVSAPG